MMLAIPDDPQPFQAITLAILGCTQASGTGSNSRLKVEVPNVDCLWYVTKLGENRVKRDEKEAIKLLTERFSRSVWDHAVIVFTHAAGTKKFPQAMQERSRLIRDAIAEHGGVLDAQKIPAVAVENDPEDLAKCPHLENWRGELYSQVISVIDEQGLLPWVIGTSDLVAPAHRKKAEDDQPAAKEESLQGKVMLTDLLMPARCGFRTSAAYRAAVSGRPSRFPFCRSCAKPDRVRSRKISCSNSAKIASRPAIARPAGVVRSSASVKETKPTPSGPSDRGHEQAQPELMEVVAVARGRREGLLGRRRMLALERLHVAAEVRADDEASPRSIPLSNAANSWVVIPRRRSAASAADGIA
jgi:hypothetical protein